MRMTQWPAILLLTGIGTAAFADAPKMKMTTDIPEGIETPNTLETHLGTLTSFDALSYPETTQKVYDDLDLYHATKAFLDALPIASLPVFKKGELEFGPPSTTVIQFE